MKIGVCIKQVPDTASRISVKPDTSGISEENIKFIISPYDEYAVEEALKTKERIEGSQVIAISVGPNRTPEALRNALAMGCDQAIHVNTEGHEEVDSLAIARLLASQIQAEGIELVFTGRYAVDRDNAQVSQMLGELLSWPHVTVVSKFDLQDGNKKARVERDAAGGAKEVWEVELPAVIAATKGLNEPRYASLKGIMQAKKKPLKAVAIGDTGVPADQLKARLQLSNFESPPEGRTSKVLKDDPKVAAAQVVRMLREEAKVI